MKKSTKVFKSIELVLGISKDQICGTSRDWEIAFARHIAASFLYSFTGQGLVAVGEMIGGRTHATVINSRVKLMNLIETDDQTVELVWMILAVMNGVEFKPSKKEKTDAIPDQKNVGQPRKHKWKATPTAIKRSVSTIRIAPKVTNINYLNIEDISY